MLHLYIGTDTAQVRKALVQALAREKARVVRITDAHTFDDFKATLFGGGLFAEKRAVVLENVLVNDDMRTTLLERLEELAKAADTFHLVLEKVDAATKKKIEKHAHASILFDLPKTNGRAFNIFALADALKRGDKKRLWIGYQNALALGNAPEAIHGILFWGAKDLLIKASAENERARARALLAEVVALPHDARRRGEDMEYALERFVLSRV